MPPNMWEQNAILSTTIKTLQAQKQRAESQKQQSELNLNRERDKNHNLEKEVEGLKEKLCELKSYDEAKSRRIITLEGEKMGVLEQREENNKKEERLIELEKWLKRQARIQRYPQPYTVGTDEEVSNSFVSLLSSKLLAPNSTRSTC